MKALLLILLFVVCPAITWAVSVTLTADTTQLSLEDSVEIQVAVQGAREGVRPEIANAENFDIQESGTSSQVQIINAKVSEQVVFGFVLSPKTSGKFTVGPARVEVEGKGYESNSIELTVHQKAPLTTDSGRFFYITAEVDDKTPFVSQQVNYTFTFYNRARLANAQLGLPEFSGFLKEGPDKQRESEQIIDGIRWQTTTLRFALFAVSAGDLTIEPARIVADAMMGGREHSLFEGFFGGARTKRVTLRSDPIHLRVRPLPSAGRASAFSGLVGQLRVSAHLEKQSLAVGDSSTLTVTLSGDANLRGFDLPGFSLSDFKVYEDAPTFEIKPEPGRWKGTKVFKRALVPLKPGSLAVPAIQVSYLEPTTGRYLLAQTPQIPLTVTGVATVDPLHHVTPQPGGSQKRAIEILGRDLMPIRRSPLAVRDDRLKPGERWALLGVGGVCALLYVALLVLKKRRERLLSDAGLSRKQKAYKRFTRGVQALDLKSVAFEETSLLLREYLGNKFNLDGRALTAIDAARKLGVYRLSQESIAIIEKFLAECEAGAYGGKKEPGGSLSGQVESLTSIVGRIEKEVR